MILNSVSVDCVIFGFDKTELRVLLTQIDKEVLKSQLPEQASSDQIKSIYEKHPVLTGDNYWSLFGSHVPEDQDLDEFAKELIFQATGLDNLYLKQLQAFGSLDRIPYTRVITVGYYSLINPEYHNLKNQTWPNRCNGLTSANCHFCASTMR